MSDFSKWRNLVHQNVLSSLQTCNSTNAPKNTLKISRIPFLCNVFSRIEVYIANAYDLLAFAADQKSGKRMKGLLWIFKPAKLLYKAIKKACESVAPIAGVVGPAAQTVAGKQKIQKSI